MSEELEKSIRILLESVRDSKLNVDDAMQIISTLVGDKEIELKPVNVPIHIDPIITTPSPYTNPYPYTTPIVWSSSGQNDQCIKFMNTGEINSNIDTTIADGLKKTDKN